MYPVEKIFRHQISDRIPRTELWLGTAILKKAGLEDDLNGHLALRKRLGMDLLFLPVSMDTPFNATLGYRYFTLDEVKEASETSDLFFGVVMDGPFQRMVEKKGLITVLTDWMRNRQGIEECYQKEAAGVIELIQNCLDLNVGAVVIADDIAADKAAYLNPVESKELFMPFYSEAVTQIHERNAYALLHSCGNFSAYIPELINSGLDGLAACQSDCMDLLSLKKNYGSELVFMAGIEADLFHSNSLTRHMKQSLENLLKKLSQGGGFILCSSCGMYDVDFLSKLQEIYRLADDAEMSR
ncbi:MAG: hypothetical protein JRI74_08035 [Deltaproteobacteria bacterium]|nr:hypothetical protein [Deltaproteobacteria bacterium]